MLYIRFKVSCFITCPEVTASMAVCTACSPHLRIQGWCSEFLGCGEGLVRFQDSQVLWAISTAFLSCTGQALEIQVAAIQNAPTFSHTLKINVSLHPSLPLWFGAVIVPKRTTCSCTCLLLIRSGFKFVLESDFNSNLTSHTANFTFPNKKITDNVTWNQEEKI